jgi:hypothetical protein
VPLSPTTTSLPPPLTTVSLPKPESTMSLPEPVVIVSLPPSSICVVSIVSRVIGRPGSCGATSYGSAVIVPLSPITTLSPSPASIVSASRPPITMSLPSEVVIVSAPPNSVVEVLWITPIWPSAT